MNKGEIKKLLLAEKKKTEIALTKTRVKRINELCSNSVAKAKRCQEDCHSVMLITQSGKTAQLDKHLEKIEQAFENLENGAYGICRGCDCLIPEKRLQACPATDLCLMCKASNEAPQDEHAYLEARTMVR